MTPNLETLATQLAQSLVDIAPEALDVALKVTVLRGAGNLLIGVILAFAAILLWPVVARAYKHDRENPYSTDTKHMFILVFGSVGVGCAILFAAITLLDIWNWIRVFAPDLALAHDVLARFTAAP